MSFLAHSNEYLSPPGCIAIDVNVIYHDPDGIVLPANVEFDNLKPGDLGYIYPPAPITWLEWTAMEHPLVQQGAMFSVKSIPEHQQADAVTNGYAEGFITLVFENQRKEVERFFLLDQGDEEPDEYPPVSDLLCVNWFQRLEDQPMTRKGTAFVYVLPSGSLLDSPQFVNVRTDNPFDGALDTLIRALCCLQAVQSGLWVISDTIELTQKGVPIAQVTRRL